jgi:hypothetical protein
MKKNLLIPVIILITAILTGCSAAAIPSQATSTATGSTVSALSATLLAAGSLKLQDTDNAITFDQASELLPLWMAYEEVNNSDTSSSQESDALVAQITSAMTSEQIAAIQAMNLTTAQIEALTSSTTSQTSAIDSSSSSQTAPAGVPSDGGMMGGDMVGAGSSSAPAMASSANSAQPVTANLALSLIEPLTKMLEAISA